MAADIEIVIGAKDQATPVINNVSKSADSNSKVLSEVGNRAKLAGTSVEGLTSAMSRNASSTENASEKATQFGLASKVSVGSVGAYAEVLKSTFTVGMQVGQMFGELIFDTKRWEEELRQATVTAGDLEQRVKKVAAIRFADQKQDIELIRDPTEKVNAYKQVIGQIDAETAGLQNRIASMRKELSEAEKEEQGNILQVFGVEFDSRVTTIPKEIEKTQKEIVELSEKRLEIERQISERTLNNEALKEQNALADRSESYIETLKKELELQKALASARGQLPADAPAPRLTGEQQTFGHAEQGKAAQALEKMPLPAASPALKLTGEQQAKIEVTTQQQTFGQADRVQATQLLTSIELLKTEGQQLQQIEKENARLEQQKVQASERIAAAKQSELDKLEMERVLLERGKAAAQAFALEKKGIDAGTAEKISVEAQRLDAEKVKAEALLNIEKERIRMTQGKEGVRAFELERKGLSKVDAKDIASQEAALNPEKKDQEKSQSQKAPPLQVFQSRLLTRGPDQNLQPQRDMASTLKRQEVIMKAQLEALKKKPNPGDPVAERIEFVVVK